MPCYILGLAHDRTYILGKDPEDGHEGFFTWEKDKLPTERDGCIATPFADRPEAEAYILDAKENHQSDWDYEIWNPEQGQSA